MKLSSKLAFTSPEQGASHHQEGLKASLKRGIGGEQTLEYSTPKAPPETEGQQETRRRACAHPDSPHWERVPVCRLGPKGGKGRIPLPML